MSSLLMKSVTYNGCVRNQRFASDRTAQQAIDRRRSVVYDDVYDDERSRTCCRRNIITAPARPSLAAVLAAGCGLRALVLSAGVDGRCGARGVACVSACAPRVHQLLSRGPAQRAERNGAAAGRRSRDGRSSGGALMDDDTARMRPFHHSAISLNRSARS